MKKIGLGRLTFFITLVTVSLLMFILISININPAQAITRAENTSYNKKDNIVIDHLHNKIKTRVNTFLIAWKGDMLITTDGIYRLNNFTKIITSSKIKKNHLYKMHRFHVKLIYVNGLLKKVLINN